jgi:glyoxylase-like metal-dependent hydrolase (beta-lactamase superfamily II)
MNIVNVGYDSTNYYVIGPDGNRLLVDVGFPRTLPKLSAMLRRKGIGLEEIRHLLVTHYHPDHAGLAQEMVNQGVRLIVMEPQVAWIPMLKTYLKPRDQYVEIRVEEAIRLPIHESRAFLKSIGFAGEIISTPGHSEDSVTLVLDQGVAFTGDLPVPQRATEEEMEAVLRSWEAIRARNATTIYPGHGPTFPAAVTANVEW